MPVLPFSLLSESPEYKIQPMNNYPYDILCIAGFIVIIVGIAIWSERYVEKGYKKYYGKTK